MIKKWDYIIVGAGSAGIPLACKISEDPSINVLLIDAGKNYEEISTTPNEIKNTSNKILNNENEYLSSISLNSEHSWGYIAQANHVKPKIHIPRGKIFGGSSSINGLVFLRGMPADYDSWGNFGGTEWNFTKILPIFNRIENDLDYKGDFHGNNGPIPVNRYKKESLNQEQLAFIESSKIMGFKEILDHNEPDSEGVGPLPLNNLNEIRWSTSLSYLANLEKRKNLKFLSEFLVEKILINKNIAKGIQGTKNQENIELYGSEIILCAGSIGTPQILMLSGIGLESHLKSHNISLAVNLPGVGENLRDHPMVHVRWNFNELFKNDNNSKAQKVALRYTSKVSDIKNDMMSIMRINQNKKEIVISSCLFSAKSSGTIKLKTSNPKDHPILDYRLLEDSFDLMRMREGVRINFELGHKIPFKKIIDKLISPNDQHIFDDQYLDNWLLKNVESTHHVSSTARMGKHDDPMSVVDQFGKVYGVTNLRIADLSIMPDCIRANTNATAIMIGEKISEFILSGK